MWLQEPAVDWELVVFGGFGLMLGFALNALFGLRSYIAIPVTALFTYIPIFVSFQIFWQGIPFRPFEFFNFEGALLYYDYPNQIYTVAIPFAFILAIGGHLPSLFHDCRAMIRYLQQRNWTKKKRPLNE